MISVRTGGGTGAIDDWNGCGAASASAIEKMRITATLPVGLTVRPKTVVSQAVARDWERFEGFGVELSHPQTTPRGQSVKRQEQRRGDLERVHLSSPDRQELYVEVARFSGITPQHEYASHKPYLEQRFGAGSVKELTQTTLRERPAWTYSFAWTEEGRQMERAALLIQVERDTYRVIYDPRSELNAQVIATLMIAE